MMASIAKLQLGVEDVESFHPWTRHATRLVLEYRIRWTYLPYLFPGGVRHNVPCQQVAWEEEGPSS